MNISVDILVFAVIAAVLLWRLRNVLGEKHDDEPQNNGLAEHLRQLQKQNDAGKNMSGAEAVSMLVNGNGIDQASDGSRWAQDLPNYAVVASATAHNHLAQLLTVDPSFRPDQFLGNAQQAFTMIIEAYSTNARTTLEFLVAQPLLQRFMQQMDRREEQHETYHVQFFGIQSALIEDAVLNGTVARITVQFAAEQSIMHKDASGTVLNGNDGQRRATSDRWIFQKDLKDPSPSWFLVEALDPIDD